MARLFPAFLVLALSSCRSGYLVQRVAVPVSLDLTSPTYGEFVGDGPIDVEGTVWPPQAQLRVEDQWVTPDADGHFRVQVPVDPLYRIIDVSAVTDSGEATARVPVFEGHDPADTWPGGVTARLLPEGMTKLGEQLGAQIDATGWEQQLADALPTVDTAWFSLVPMGVSHSSTSVELKPADEGVDAAVEIQDLLLEYQLDVPALSWSGTIGIGFGQAAVGLRLIPSVDAAGLVNLDVSDSRVDLENAVIQLDGVDALLLELLADAVNQYIVEPVAQTLGDLILQPFQGISLGGPYEYDFDLLGTHVDTRLSDLWGDLDGLGLAVGVGLDNPASDPTDAMPTPTEADAPADAQAAVALHEGLVDLTVLPVIGDYLGQDLELPGTLGAIVTTGLAALPGGDQIPSDVGGWCLSIDPGTAKVARLRSGLGPLAVVVMPDLHLRIEQFDGTSCGETWIDASLAVLVDLNVDGGTRIGFSMEVPEGVLNSYGADIDPSEEPQVIDGLGTWLDGISSLLGGAFNLDLSSLFGGSGLPAGNLSPEILDSEPMLDADGQPVVEGLYSVSLDLWP